MNLRREPPTFVFNKLQFFIGLAALGLGSLVYLVLRSPDQVYFTKLFGIHQPLFQVHSHPLSMLGRSLPAFSHIFSFILITASFFPPRKKTYVAICAVWMVIDVLFELGQKYKTAAVKLIPDFFDKIPFLESTEDFFRLGTFDNFDLVAFALGAVAAYGVVIATTTRNKTKN